MAAAMTPYISVVMSKLVLFLAVFPLLRIKSSFLNIEELQKLKYGVEISGEPVLLNHQDTEENIMHVKSKHGQQYQCVLPVKNIEGDKVNQKNITTEEINNLLLTANDTCLYFVNGWWTYKVCFGKSVYQYHDDGLGEDMVKDNISLGHYSGETDWSQFNTETHSQDKEIYHSQFYSNGTLCDLTGELRKTEVRFYCNQNGIDNIARIDESSTCTYTISVHTNKLCNYSIFRPKEPVKKYSISCSPALIHEQYMKYTESKENVVDDMLGSPSGTTVKDDEPTTKKRIPSIFEALGKLFQKGDTKHGDGANKDEEDRIDIGDVLKKSRNVIDKSVEKIRKGKLYKKLETLADNVDQDELSELPNTQEIEEDSIKEPRTGSNDFYEAEKARLEKQGKYYHDLIEGLKIQYRFFKKELEIVTSDMHKKIEKLENGDGKTNPILTRLAKRIKATVKQFEENQRTLDVEMERLTDLNDAVMNDENPAVLKEEIANIRSRLQKLMKKITSKRTDHDDEVSGENNEDYGSDKKNSKGKKHDVFDMESPKLDKVVSKLKKIMTQDAEGNQFEDGENDNLERLDDDRISVRVTKIRDKEDDLFDKSLYVEDEKDLEDIKGDEEMMAATRKMEKIVRKQLQEAGIKHEGKVKVKIITSRDALKRVSGGTSGFQILSPDETSEFTDLISNLLGGNQESMKEKERQDKLEKNYNLVWSRNGFTSIKDDYSSVDHEKDRKKYT